MPSGALLHCCDTIDENVLINQLHLQFPIPFLSLHRYNSPGQYNTLYLRLNEALAIIIDQFSTGEPECAPSFRTVRLC